MKTPQDVKTTRMTGGIVVCELAIKLCMWLFCAGCLLASAMETNAQLIFSNPAVCSGKGGGDITDSLKAGDKVEWVSGNIHNAYSNDVSVSYYFEIIGINMAAYASGTATVRGGSTTTVYSRRISPPRVLMARAYSITFHAYSWGPGITTTRYFTVSGVSPMIYVQWPGGSSMFSGNSDVFLGTVVPGRNASLLFTIRNNGTANLTGLGTAIGGTNSGDFTVTTAPTASIIPGASTTFTVKFAPGALGYKQAVLHIASNDIDGNPFDIDLSGQCVAPVVDIAVEQPANTGLADGVSSISFTAQLIGSSDTKVFTIRNKGTVDLTGLAVTRDGPHSGDFAAGALELTTLVPGASTTFNLTFTPSAAGMRSAAIHIVSNDADENPFDIALSGTGVVPVAEIVVEEPLDTGLEDGISSITFTTQLIGSSATKTFTIRNTGNVDLTGLAVTRDGHHRGDFATGTLRLTTLVPGASTTFDLTFTPSAAGMRSAALHIVSNDADENPFDISLTGSGCDTLYADWTDVHGLIGDNALPNAIPFGDGVSNILKYAFNLNGDDPDCHILVRGTGTSGLPVLTRDDSGGAQVFRFEFLRRKFSDLIYTPKQSATLQQGSWVPVTGSVTVTGLDETWERVVVEQSYDPTAPCLLFRVDVAKPDYAPEGFALIPAGSFWMGDSFANGWSDEVPVHMVQVSAFYMAKYEVTKSLWDEVRSWGLANGYTNLPTGFGNAANYPVQSIVWYDMVKWCNARSEKEGLTPCYTVAGAVYRSGSFDPDCNWAANGYRLPTEAEWEKAARGGFSGRRFPWGDTIMHSQANYYSSSSYSYDVSQTRGYHPAYGTGTAPVGSFAANGYGLYDMTGNVEEWCWDRNAYYPSTAQTDPRGPASGSYRVTRGGNWYSHAFDCRVSARYLSYPGTNINSYDGGFRLARSSVP